MRSEEEVKREVILAQATLTNFEERMNIPESRQDREVISSAIFYYKAKIKWLRWVLGEAE